MTTSIGSTHVIRNERLAFRAGPVISRITFTVSARATDNREVIKAAIENIRPFSDT